MKHTPQQFRESIAATRATDGRCVALSIEDALVLADAMEIADSCARSDIESHCTARGDGEDYRYWWWDTSSADDEDEETVVQALRYCEARGMIERHPTDAPLVKFKGAA